MTKITPLETEVLTDSTLIIYPDANPRDLSIFIEDLDPYTKNEWQKATYMWLASQKAKNTRRAYERHLKEFLAWCGKAPWLITSSDCQLYVNHCKEQGLKPETVNAKIAAVSSYYKYLFVSYHIIHPDGHRGPLVHYNPAADPNLRTKITPYGKSHYLDSAELNALSSTLAKKRTNVQGLRDYALFKTYVNTGRRNSEIRLLKWGNFFRSGGVMWYRWSGKGKTDQKSEIPLDVWADIETYLQAAGRLDKMQPEDYIFTAVSTNGFRLACVAARTDAEGNHRPYDPAKEPLSLAQIGVLLKKYCRKAGLDASKIHPHTLRHTAAMSRKAVGDSLDDIQKQLGHSNIATTQIYLDHMSGHRDTSWAKVKAYSGF